MDLEKEKDIFYENNKLLKELHADIHKDRRSKAVEILTAIILSLAAVGSAWCAYQSTLWDGVQSFKLSDEIVSTSEASENSIRGAQIRAFDAILFMKFVESFHKKDDELAEFYYNRFNPTLKKSTDEWIATKPLTNIDAPKTPFELESYKVEFEEIAKELKAKSSEFLKDAEEANTYSDKYVLLTVLFASVLFFGGISGTLRSHRTQLSAFFISSILLFGTLIILIGMPICNQ